LKRIFINTITGIGILFILLAIFPENTSAAILGEGNLTYYTSLQDTSKNDLIFPFKDEEAIPETRDPQSSPLYLDEPSNLERNIEYDPETGEYIFERKIGELDYRPSTRLTLDEYMEYQMEKSVREYWQEKARGEAGNRGDLSFAPQFNLGGEAFDMIFGSNTINIVPQGSAELIFGFNVSRVDNPTLSEKLRRTPSFNFEEKIQMNVNGTIGERMKLGINYNTEATFEFENKTKLEYAGEEDDIIQKIEAGNVTLPLTGSLITGSQSLFGLKTELKFGKLSVTSVFSQQKGETSVIEVAGGAQLNEYEVPIDEYEANKHFFLGQYFYENYNNSLKQLPLIASGINITRVEVWITNKTNNFENSRDIVAFMDLGEGFNPEGGPNFYGSESYLNPTRGNLPPSNEINDLYEKVKNLGGIRDIGSVSDALSGDEFSIGRNYEKIQSAKKLSPREYTLNAQLGYISLNRSLNADEILAVAFEYNYRGKTYQVGELSTGGISAPKALVLKLLKGTNLTPSLPTWTLMMKNIYSIGAYQVQKEDFVLNVLYEDDESGTALNYLPIASNDVSKDLLLNIFEMDNLNNQLDPYPDGVFDFIPNITVNPNNGRVIFPLVEPFGKDLADYLDSKGVSQEIIDEYVYTELYDSTQTKARQVAEKNKFILEGMYQSSSSSEISLNAMNVPQGSVVVTAGGIKLQENVQYTVDYTLGRVKILDQGLLESGTPIQISLESNSLFNIQTKTLVGTHLDYRISDNFNVGGTILNLTERPLTKKVNIGDEPISNTIWGLNTSYQTQSQWLTTMVDKLPFLETKAPSSISFDGEFAHLIPGQSKAIGKSGIAYIDDFEGSETSIDIKSFPSWVLASTPMDESLFPESIENNNLEYNRNRAKIAWYVIDPLFLRDIALTPSHIRSNPDVVSNHYVREVYEKEIFPNKETPNNIPTNIPVLNVAFYPRERGNYNFVADELNPDGSLRNPKEKWGGIMREIQTNDFEAANVEYIEFWLMDPFFEDTLTNNRGGELYFNLGEVSEDIMKDSRKFFENGLPIPSEPDLVDTTVWGRVPVKQSTVNAFDTDEDTRKYQDVGFDGLDNEQELSFFSDFITSIEGTLDPEAVAKIKSDPSGDDFHYFRGGDYDQQKLGVLERYKNYNGSEGNSPTSGQSDEDYPTTGSTLPNVEDINRDNTLNETETYYQYRVNLSKEGMQVGQNFIVDKVTGKPVEFSNNEKSSVDWYQFRIPISEYENTVGPISDFKSIRFLRMFLTGFSDSIILRFAKMDLVRGEWRKYNLSMRSAAPDLTSPQQDEGGFEISAVNIEENAGKTPVNYVLPPGIDRVIDPTNPQLRQLNEQSMVFKVYDLEDNDARAAFKNLNMDIRQYKNLKMEVHAEQIPGTILNDGDLTAFIRVGSDYKNNFYEYEVPLELTPYRSDYDNDNPEDRKLVWPEGNSFDIELGIFQRAKQARNDELRREGSTLSLTSPFIFYDDNGNKVTISGSPNLSNVRVIMIGVRNPGNDNNAYPNDNLPKTGEIWFNELRLTDFNDQGGWAANARVTTRFADFGSVTIASSTSTPGFGSIEKKVNERSKEQALSYDVSGNFELGKFFPEDARVSIPVYAAISEQRINPQYNPLDPDIPLKAALENSPPEVRDSIKNIAQDYTSRKSFNVTNVRIGPKPGGKPKIYDISNWAASYAYSESFQRNIKTEFNTRKQYRGALSYNYSMRPKNVAPFKQVKFLDFSLLKLIKEFNFYYLPSNISFRTDLNRQYNEMKLRSLNNPYPIPVTVNKNFLWNRFFDIKYDLTRSLKLDFSATTMARIDEPSGAIRNYRDSDTTSYEYYKEEVWDNIMNGGRPINYNHSLNATYTLPINKLPLFNWVTASARYGASYAWTIGPQTSPSSTNDESSRIGNTIKNSNTMQLNSQANLLNLYNKVNILKELNQPGRGKQEKQYKTVTYEKRIYRLSGGREKYIFHRLGTEDIQVKVINEQGNEVKGTVEIVNENKIAFTPDEDQENTIVTVEGQVEKMKNPLIFIAENLGRIAMSVKNVSISYSQTNGTMLPGYEPPTTILGMTSLGSSAAPGYPFILGYQDREFAYKAERRGWLKSDSLLNNPWMLTSSENLNVRSNLEPLPGLKIDLTMNRNKSTNQSEYFTPRGEGIEFSSKMESGNFSMSFISIRTAFETPKSDNNYESEAFENFKSYRDIISQRLVENRMMEDDAYNPFDTTGTGYGPGSQQVLVPAFLAAYGGFEPENVGLSPFPEITRMLPNWRITFDGLSKIEFIKEIFRSVNLNHAYRSSYNIGAYSTNPMYQENPMGYSRVLDLNNNFIPQYEFATVSITEQFSPLVGVDITMKNSLSTRVEIKKSRNLNLSLVNNQIMEIRSDELVVGVGYRFNEVPLVIRSAGGQRDFESDLNVRADVSIRDNKTILRRLDAILDSDFATSVNEASAGQNVVTIKFTADYVLSDRFNLRFFFDRVVNNPLVSTSFPTANTEVGFSVRFTLIQ